MDDFLFIGDILIRRGAGIYHYDNYFGDELYDLNYEMSLNGATPAFQKLSNFLERLDTRFREKDGLPDWSHTKEFYIISNIDQNNIEVESIPEYSIFEKSQSSYRTISELKQDFFSLTEMLTKGEYIGQNFHRTKPVINPTGTADGSYCSNVNHNMIVLYKHNDVLLTIENGEYKIISSRYLTDGNYEFLGPVHNEYNDPKKVHKEVSEQIDGYKAKRKK